MDTDAGPTVIPLARLNNYVHLAEETMKKFVTSLTLLAFVTIFAACGSSQDGGSTGKVIKSATAGNGLTVSLATPDGVLKHGNSQFTLTFADSTDKPVDVGAVALTFHMPQMGTMAEMNDAATFTTTATPGVYDGKAQIEVAGEWQVKITYDGPKGRGQASFPVTAQ
ncbi:MAG TPA: FixH family protein [Pyrinomonadaceae bacterium]